MRRKYWPEFQCVKSVRIWSFSGPHFLYSDEYKGIWSIPYSIQIRKNLDQKNSEYGHFPRSVWYRIINPTWQTNVMSLLNLFTTLRQGCGNVSFDHEYSTCDVLHKASTILVQCCNTDVWKTLWIWLVVTTLYRHCHCNKKDVMWHKFTIQR